MRCVPTCAVMDETDVELARARQQLRERLFLLERHLGGAGDAMPEAHANAPWHEHEWKYIGSAPWREDDGTIVYVHGFRHMRLMRGDGPLAIAILSSPGWWPVGCGHRNPRRTAPRGKLRLVS